MFNIDEKHLYPMGRPNPDTGMFPPPPHDEHKPHRPAFTMSEEVERLAAETRATCARMLEYSKRMDERFADMTRHLTSDNVIFKDTFAQAHAQFVQEVKNEVNIFEANMNSALTLFQKTMESEIAEDLQKQNAILDDAVGYMKDNLSDSVETTVQEMYESGELTEIVDRALNVHNVKYYGAVGDGVTDDTNAIKLALASTKRLFFPSGTYVISDAISLPENTLLEGENYKSATLLFKYDNACLSFVGTSINSAIPAHKKFLTIRELQFRSEEPDTQMLYLSCCDYVKVENCWIYGRGQQVYLNEVFDSRFINTDFEWGGEDGVTDAVGVSLDGGKTNNTGGYTYDYTNNIYFIGCRFESHQGICVGTAPNSNNVNKIVFTDCKFESFNVENNNAVRFVNASSIYFRDCFFMGKLNNAKNYVYIDQCEDIVLTGYGDHRSGDYSGKKLFYVSGSRKIDIALNLNTNNAYDVDYYTFGIDTYDPATYGKMRIKVNKYDNADIVVSNITKTFTPDTAYRGIRFNAPYTGMVIFKGAGGVTDGSARASITVYDDYAGEVYDGLATSVNCAWVCHAFPVIEGQLVYIGTDTFGECYAVCHASKYLMPTG